VSWTGPRKPTIGVTAALEMVLHSPYTEGPKVMYKALIMFDDPVLVAVNTILLLGVVLAIIAVPKIMRGNRKLHEETLALRKRIYHKS
jgi:hypothetical protein